MLSHNLYNRGAREMHNSHKTFTKPFTKFTNLILVLCLVLWEIHNKHSTHFVSKVTSTKQVSIVAFMCTVDTCFIFAKKNQILQNVLLISVMLRWHSGVKNHEIWTFKVNFLFQKTSESF